MSAKGGQKTKKQNTKLKMQNSKYSKHKNQNHKQIRKSTPPEAEKYSKRSLIDHLIWTCWTCWTCWT